LAVFKLAFEETFSIAFSFQQIGNKFEIFDSVNNAATSKITMSGYFD